jgi:hypothetical protein
VNLAEFYTGLAAVITLLTLAGYFGWRQVGLLRRPPAGVGARDYFRSQAWRRLACCGLMAALAGLLAGYYFLDRPFRELLGQARGAAPTSEQQRFINLFTLYWTGVLVVLAFILGVAGYDLWSLRRFSVREQRKIQADRRAMIDRQAARHRLERN